VISGVFTTDKYHLGPYTLEDEGGKKLAFKKLAELVDALTALHKTVYLVAEIPAGKEFGAKINMAVKRPVFLTFSSGLGAYPTTPKADVIARLQPIHDQLMQIAKQHRAIFIDPVAYLCSQDACRTDTHMDAGHLRTSYVKQYVDYLDKTVQEP
jgi:SGNH domain (fused to AT3 domains)